ncbi:cobamide remodeling phosphodiesterase CbiR [Maridesulfovibrio sp.]|uniref:cobamide remodeling phosphodiesterase CbiR n=1 Tax=Maridesulfovibrio sp. TaxID=2795000 RepID=UPI002A18D118|nr:cobamide remodeling phosphodiesterase CbiR [Maridesulfovibrio sp.]
MFKFLNTNRPKIVLAAPSWVIPGTVAENCFHLAGKVDEIALLFFETEACLKYTRNDLPTDLAETGLSFHIHHPLDLPWSAGGDAVAGIVLELASLAAHLSPRAHVIHPPEDGPEAEKALMDFAGAIRGAGFDPGMFLFENIKENSLSDYVGTIRECGFGICLDLGHILSYGQHSLLDGQIKGIVRMLHLNAPGPGGKHAPLDSLSDSDIPVLDVMFSLLDGNGTVTVEVFEEVGFSNSLKFLEKYFADK